MNGMVFIELETGTAHPSWNNDASYNPYVSSLGVDAPSKYGLSRPKVKNQ